ncbi:protein kinase [Roseiconus nitratireducens]|uniref:non-specific serine/threonine protein kinase n=1 Tax=Roseiconus nitratireducens TaxID=2605748 RepID=A0A5M6DB82_9BACT|nr:protein kinase [Roseiconus nitratireducens]KAA5543766.1 protein kinase [Roseiconus nitratireducens]
MQIECPHCSAKLQLGAVKPGRFRLTCKRCGKRFVIDLSDQSKPRLHIESPKQPTVTGRSEDAAMKTRAATVGDPSGVAASRPSEVDGAPDGQLRPRSVSDRDGEEDGSSDLAPIPAKLGGYRIIRMLGRGAMGAVYQAKQISLDRDVALKTIRGRLAENPASLARFTREAYAAAQLSHHNVVQIYDFGEDSGQHYFSMEWVRGGSLADLVRDKGRLDPKLAATYILQAARGLQFAHRNGMVHRDIKPGNLLLSEDGVVKVADLGLVKVPDMADPQFVVGPDPRHGIESGTQVTIQGTAVGTPAYMAPEQTADASTVDHRADIYSLGCSLFFLLTGRPPYEGSDLSQVARQHAKAPLPKLSQADAKIPEELSAIVARAMEKRPADRYAALAEMIDDLQDYLGVEALTGFTPTREQADRWEKLSSAYAKTQQAKRATDVLVYALASAAVVLMVLCPLFSVRWILFGPSIFVAACTTALVWTLAAHASPTVEHLRRWIGLLGWFELAVGAFGLIVAVAVILVSGLTLGTLAGVVIGFVLGTAYHFGISVASEQAGRADLEGVKKFVRDLRIDGAEESGLRDFLARYAGGDWRPTYEALFGYSAMAEMRRRLTLDNTFTGPTQASTLRDRICRKLATKIERKRKAKTQRELAKIEQRSLVSQGISQAEARQQAWQMASALMESARYVTDTSGRDDRVAADAKRQRIKAMLADARSGKYVRPRDRYAAVKFAFSGYTRMLVGSLLLLTFSLAAQSTGLLSQEVVSRVHQGDLDLQTLSTDAQADAFGGTTNVWSIGIAGVLLCFSAFVSGWRMTPFAVVATLVILFGPALGVPAVGPVAAWMVAALIGLVIYLPGVIFGEEREFR